MGSWAALPARGSSGPLTLAATALSTGALELEASQLVGMDKGSLRHACMQACLSQLCVVWVEELMGGQLGGREAG